MSLVLKLTIQTETDKISLYIYFLKFIYWYKNLIINLDIKLENDIELPRVRQISNCKYLQCDCKLL